MSEDTGRTSPEHALSSLAAEGFSVLLNHTLPSASIVHVVIGPSGVLVVVPKEWKVAPSVSGGRLRAGRYDQHATVEKAKHLKAHVSRTLEAVGAPGEVHVALYFPNGAGSTPDHVEDVLLWDASDVPHTRSLLGGEAGSNQEEVLAAVVRASPSAAPRIPAPPAEGFDKRYSVLHARERRRPHALHLYGPEGVEVGYHNFESGEVVVSRAAGEFSQAILRGVRPRDLSQVQLPSLPSGSSFGERLVGSLLGARRSALIGWEWEHRGQHRLYVHLLETNQPVREIGNIDLRTDKVVLRGEQVEDETLHEQLIRYTASLLPRT